MTLNAAECPLYSSRQLLRILRHHCTLLHPKQILTECMLHALCQQSLSLSACTQRVSQFSEMGSVESFVCIMLSRAVQYSSVVIKTTNSALERLPVSRSARRTSKGWAAVATRFPSRCCARQCTKQTDWRTSRSTSIWCAESA